MKISEVISFLESLAHPSLQESYDNSGLLTGDPDWECTGIICSLDATEAVIKEAIEKKANMIVAHHPIIFSGLKKVSTNNYVGQALITAIKNDIAIYAIHTNLDNVLHGVSGKMADLLGLKNIAVLAPQTGKLRKLFTFIPVDKTEEVRQAIFGAGGGHIGKYSECSFNTEGTGTFTAGPKTNPFVGEQGKAHQEKEIKTEIIFPTYLEQKIISALKAAHPYEEVAYDIMEISNSHPGIGAGVIGELLAPMSEESFLDLVKRVFKLPFIRHTAFSGRIIKKVAVCGGAGSFLISKALAAKADVYITGDLKYHEFFEANGRLLLADIGHFESEQFTINLLHDVLEEKFPTFAVLKTGVRTNPVFYFPSEDQP